MAVKRFVVAALAAGVVAGPVAAEASAPRLVTASGQVQSVSHSAAKANAAADAIELEVERNGSLAVTLTWSGGVGPYDVLIDASTGTGGFESDIDDTTLTTAAEPDRGYCFKVFGSDGSESSRECVSGPSL